MEIKEAQDVELSGPVEAREAHLVLIPKPSTHHRDPLVCAHPWSWLCEAAHAARIQFGDANILG